MNRLYDIGRIDENLKNEFIEEMCDETIPCTREIMNKILHVFFKSNY